MDDRGIELLRRSAHRDVLAQTLSRLLIRVMHGGQRGPRCVEDLPLLPGLKRLFHSRQGRAQSCAMVSGRSDQLLFRRAELGAVLRPHHRGKGWNQAGGNRFVGDRLQPLPALRILAPVVAGDGPNKSLPRSQRAAVGHLRQRQERVVHRPLRHRLERARQCRGRLAQRMLWRQGGNRGQRRQVIDPLTNEGFDAVAVFPREIRVAQGADHPLQPTLDRRDFPILFL